MKINLTFSKNFDALIEEYLSDPLGEQLLKLEGIHPSQLDVGQMSHDYFTKEVCDMSVDANANSNEDNCYNNYQAEITKGLHKIEGYYLLYRYAEKRFGKARADELLISILNGNDYFHDPTKIQIPYCYAYSTSFVMENGRPYGQLKSVPPKRSDSFMAEVIETTMDLSQEFAGAIAMGDLIVNLCYFLKKEGITPIMIHELDNEGNRQKLVECSFSWSDKAFIVNQFQKLIHVMNNKFRLGGESPFSNISIFDRPNLEKLFGETIYPDGSTPDFDFIEAVQDIFMEFFSKGDPNTGLPYRFPVVTVNMEVDADRKPLDMNFAKRVAHYNREKGCFNIYANEGSKIAMCCRFVNDSERMDFKADSFGNGGMNIGSHRVVTVNLPRLALRCRDIENMEDREAEFFARLQYELDICKDLLLVHREEILERRIERGFLKFFDKNQVGWFDLNTMFSTIGLVGVYEMCDFMGYDILSPKGADFVSRVLKYIDDKAIEYSKETGYSFNTEEIPAENTGVKIAKKDNLLFGLDTKMYSNQYIPLVADAPIMRRITLTGNFMSLVSGGGILHLNVKDKIDTDEKMLNLLLLALKNGVEHFAINYGFCECENGHVTIGGNTTQECIICGAPIKDHITRVVGFYTRVSNWSQTRKEEFKNRKFK